MSKYLKFQTTVYNDNMLDSSVCMRPVFEENVEYEVIFENDTVYLLAMPETSVYKGQVIGIEKGLEDFRYIIVDK